MSANARVFDSLRNGFSRFFDEGFYVWSAEQLARILPEGLTLKSAELIAQLDRWQKTGFIRLSQNPVSVVTVLRARTDAD
jgi:hypothetical protein